MEGDFTQNPATGSISVMGILHQSGRTTLFRLAVSSKLSEGVDKRKYGEDRADR
jgi:hypothetical protein